MYVRYAYAQLRKLFTLLFQKLDYTEGEAIGITDVILTADLFNIESHGCQRLKLYIDGVTKIGRIKQSKKPEIIRETPCSALIEGYEYIGQIVSITGTNIAIEKAKANGMALVCVRNSNHFGIAGYYAKKIAENHLLGMVMTNTEAIMIPTHGKKPLLGTNPIAVGMYAEPYPYLFDAATTVVPRGKLEIYAKRSTPIPDGWAVDNTGKICNDPVAVIDFINNKNFGGILPLGGIDELSGGHKGYGLSLLVEIMTGIFAGGITSNRIREKFYEDRCSHMFMAIDYGMFGDPQKVEAQLSSYLRLLRDSPAIEGKQIITHGQKEMLNQEYNLKHGIRMNGKTYQEIEEICRQFNLEPEKYLVPVN